MASFRKGSGGRAHQEVPKPQGCGLGGRTWMRWYGRVQSRFMPPPAARPRARCPARGTDLPADPGPQRRRSAGEHPLGVLVGLRSRRLSRIEGCAVVADQLFAPGARGTGHSGTRSTRRSHRHPDGHGDQETEEQPGAPSTSSPSTAYPANVLDPIAMRRRYAAVECLPPCRCILRGGEAGIRRPRYEPLRSPCPASMW
jgi:hypothetical protein